jgi:lipoprotein-anchoring transpeptidase ErfK/SrfK
LYADAGSCFVRTFMVSRVGRCLTLALLGLAACDRGDGAPAESLAAVVASVVEPSPEPSASADVVEDVVAPAGPAEVDLGGVSHPAPPPSEAAPRIASITLTTDVYAKPDRASRKLGYLRGGAIVEAEPGKHRGAGCPGGFRRIKPSGFVCLGDEATEDLAHPIVRAASRRPDFSQKLPYMYGTVTRGGPVYARIPTEADLATHEPSLAKHLAKWRKDAVSGADYGLDVWLKWNERKDVPSAWDAWEQKVSDPEIPAYLRDGGRVPNLSGLVKSSDAVKIDQVDRRNGVAFVESFLWQGRRYNVSTDLRVMPADRFRPIRGSDFHGWEIGKDVTFPFALVRKQGGKRYTWNAAKKRPVESGDLAWRTAVQLTGKQKLWNGILHYETTDGDYVDDRHAGRVDPAKKMPKWAKDGEKWLDVNITKQVLVAYEGEKAVYVTLVSTGEHGLDDPDKTRATKRGIFRIHTKHVSVTMDSDVVGEEFELRDVPYVQYFEGGYALHGSYWHDVFGQPKSHGCINLAPEDARRIFFWTEPQVPPGWHAASRPLTGTVLFVHP